MAIFLANFSSIASVQKWAHALQLVQAQTSNLSNLLGCSRRLPLFDSWKIPWRTSSEVLLLQARLYREVGRRGEAQPWEDLSASWSQLPRDWLFGACSNVSTSWSPEAEAPQHQMAPEQPPGMLQDGRAYGAKGLYNSKKVVVRRHGRRHGGQVFLHQRGH